MTPFRSLNGALALVALMIAAAPAHAQAPAAQAAAPALPQVSPVDQFKLNGPYLFAPRAETGKTLNEQRTGRIEIDPFQAGQQTAQWVFEAVPASPFVRIKNQALNTYLADVDGMLQAM